MLYRKLLAQLIIIVFHTTPHHYNTSSNYNERDYNLLFPAINNQNGFYYNLKVFLNRTEGRKFASHIKWNDARDRIEVDLSCLISSLTSTHEQWTGQKYLLSSRETSLIQCSTSSRTTYLTIQSHLIQHRFLAIMANIHEHLGKTSRTF
jgi:hypothetical protein